MDVVGFEDVSGIDVDVDVEGAVDEEGPGRGSGGPAVMGSIFGRKIELISPIPTKKSSGHKNQTDDKVRLYKTDRPVP